MPDFNPIIATVSVEITVDLLKVLLAEAEGDDDRHEMLTNPSHLTAAVASLVDWGLETRIDGASNDHDLDQYHFAAEHWIRQQRGG